MKKRMESEAANGTIDPSRNRYPYCVVWTPLPIISWFIPFIGHMGICTSAGVIRDFSAPYYVSEDQMGFGNPTMYWQMSPSSKVASTWDGAVHQASEEYSYRMHNLFCDNCHSHVARALNLMQYNNSTSWNMYKLGFLMVFKGKFVGIGGFLKTWLPFFVISIVIIIIAVIVTTAVKTTTS